MITVRIPAEIRKYKEKLIFGLTRRQLLSLVFAAIAGTAIYFIGTHMLGMSGDVTGWVVLVVGGCFWVCGFFNYHGAPMERAAVAFLKYMICPGKRVVHTTNKYREAYDAEKRKNEPQGWRQKNKMRKYERQASLERIVLMQEAEGRGDMTHESVDLENLRTVRKPESGGTGGKRGNKPDKKQKKSTKKPGWVIKAEAVQAKLDADPYYITTKRESKLLRRWNKKKLADAKRDMEKKKLVVAKQNNWLKKRRTVQFRIPKTVADSIPILAVYDEGMFEIAPNKYSVAWQFSDVNYKTAREEQKEEIFCRLRDFYNSFSDDVRIQVCVDNRAISKEQVEREVFYPLTGDQFDKHRTEHNRILALQMRAGRNNIRCEKYIVVTIDASEPMEALYKFHKLGIEIENEMRKMGVIAKRVGTTDRLAFFHDKFRPGQEGNFRIDYEFLEKEGLSEKDYIAPPAFNFSKSNSLMIGDMYYRVMYLTGLSGTMSDDVLRDFYDVDFPVTVTLNIRPVDPQRATKLVNRQLTSIKKDKMDAERKAIKDGYSPENIREDIKDSFRETVRFREDMQMNNQKLFFVSVTVMVGGKDRQELENNCGVITGKAQSHQTTFQTLKYQQEEGYKTTLPFGYVSKDLVIDRTMTSESTTIFIPFTCTEIYQLGGYFYGLNTISKNIVMLDRTKMKRTGSGFTLGSTGSGKSFACKLEILNILLHDNNSSVIIIDPENEYYDFTRVFGGTTMKIAPDSPIHINPMDMPEDYGLDENDNPETVPLAVKKAKAIKKKSSFIMSVVERMISTGGNGDMSTITPQQKTYVDRCVRECYKEYLDHDFDEAYLPTLLDFQDRLDALKADSEVARELAEGVEYYTRGSMDVFAYKTNVDLKNRLICINIRDLGEQLRLISFVIVFDFVWSRLLENKARSVWTYCYCDEIHVMFKTYYAAEFFRDLYKRGRKYGLIVNGITQNVTELLNTEQARLMIGNSDFVMILNQKAEDLEMLAKILHITEEQKSFVSGAEVGSGLIYAEEQIVPFTNKFPEDSYLYTLMSTKFGEIADEEAKKQIQHIMEGVNG